MRIFFYFLSLIIYMQPLIVSALPNLVLSKSVCTKIYLPTADEDSHIKVQTENLIRYLSLLIEDQHINSNHLQIMLTNADQGVLQNPITQKQARSASVLKIIYDGIQSVLDKNNIV